MNYFSFKKIVIFGAKQVGKTYLTNLFNGEIIQNESYSDEGNLFMFIYILINI